MLERFRATRNQELRIYGSPVVIHQLSLGDKPTCTFLGPEGSYTHEALSLLLDGQVDFKKNTDNGKVVRDTNEQNFDLGLVPVENSTGGTVTETIREIVHSDLQILGEIVLPIHHSLLGNLEEGKIPVIHSHRQGLSQCSNLIMEMGAQTIESTSTSQAVIDAKAAGHLAIASKFAGQIHGLPVIREAVENLKYNVTRFWLLGHGETKPTLPKQDTTIIQVSFPQAIGKIRDALGLFADRGISCNNISSYPMGALYQYYFLLDIQGHKDDPKVKEAIKQLALPEYSLRMRVLGSFHKSPVTEKNFEPSAIEEGWARPEDIHVV